jgi:hypothetical protein
MEHNYLAERQAEQKRRYDELDDVTKFHQFLQGEIPEGVTVKRFKKMNADQAFTVIWFLQEVCHLLDERFEMCDECKTIYDSYAEGNCGVMTGRCYCGSCDLGGDE